MLWSVLAIPAWPLFESGEGGAAVPLLIASASGIAVQLRRLLR